MNSDNCSTSTSQNRFVVPSLFIATYKAPEVIPLSHCLKNKGVLKEKSIAHDSDGNMEKLKRFKEVMVLGQIRMLGKKIILQRAINLAIHVHPWKKKISLNIKDLLYIIMV